MLVLRIGQPKGWEAVEKALGKKGRAGLSLVEVTDKNGRKMRVWKKVEKTPEKKKGGLSVKDILDELKKKFGLSRESIASDYAKNGIERDFGCDRDTFAKHVWEYFTHREKWDGFFSKKENAEKHRKPVKQEAGKERPAISKDKDKADAAKMPLNRSLMRRVWSIYSPEGKRAAAEEKLAEKESGKLPKSVMYEGKKWDVRELDDGNVELTAKGDFGGGTQTVKIGTKEQFAELLELEKKNSGRPVEDGHTGSVKFSGATVALPDAAEFRADLASMTALRERRNKAETDAMLKDPLDKQGLRMKLVTSPEYIEDAKEISAIAAKYAYMGVNLEDPTEKDVARTALNYFDIFDREGKLLDATVFLHDSASPQFGGFDSPLRRVYEEKAGFKDTELANAIRSYGRKRDAESREVLERYADMYGDDHYNRSLAMLGNQNARKDGADRSRLNDKFTGDAVPEAERRKDLVNQRPVEILMNDFRGLTDKETRTVAKQKYGLLKSVEKDGIHIEFPMSGYRETNQHSADKNVLYVLGQLGDIMRNAVFMYSEPNSDPKKTSTINMLNYAAKTMIDGEEYYTRLVIREDKDGNFYYDNDSTSVEKVKANLEVPVPISTGVAHHGSLSEADSRLNTAPNAGHHGSPYMDRISQWLAGVKENVNNKHDRAATYSESLNEYKAQYAESLRGKTDAEALDLVVEAYSLLAKKLRPEAEEKGCTPQELGDPELDALGELRLEYGEKNLSEREKKYREELDKLGGRMKEAIDREFGQESEAEEHGNRSRAMMGNQNARKEFSEECESYFNGSNLYPEVKIKTLLKEAAGDAGKEDVIKELAGRKGVNFDTVKRIVEAEKEALKSGPQTEPEKGAEQARTKKTREKAGRPKTGKNMGERVSAMEDAVSYNPNAENYAYKDTGYIAGSQKEKIQDFWKRMAELGRGVGAEEIDWDALEENGRYADKMITKKNIMGDPDFDGWRENGMNSRAAFLASKVLAAVGKEPVDHTESGRKNYVIAIDTLKSRLAGCKGCRDVIEVLDDIYGEASQTFNSQIRRDPEMLALNEKSSQAVRRGCEMEKKFDDEFLEKISEKWPSSKEQKAHLGEIEKLAQSIADGIEPDSEHFLSVRMVSIPGVGSCVHASARFNQAEEKAARKEIRAKTDELREKYRQNDCTHEIWKQLGEKFNDLHRSEAFQKHYASLKIYDADARFKVDAKTGEKRESYYYTYRDKSYDKYDSWDWTGEAKQKREKDSEIIKGRTKRRFEMIVPKTLERRGGRDVSVRSTEELKKAFNFREVQTGSYVQTDPASAKWHVDNLATGFADLCDVTGIPDNLVSLNGRLAVAIGARGHGGALAHYEPVERVINITKMRGGGSLGHEWFHAFDNLIAEAMNGGDYNQWLTNPDLHGRDKPLGADDTNGRVRAAFGGLMEAIMSGDTPETRLVEYKAADYKAGKRLFGNAGLYGMYGGFQADLSKSKTLDEAVGVINGKYGKAVGDIIKTGLLDNKNVSSYAKQHARKLMRAYNDYLKMAAAWFGGKEEDGSASVKTGRTVSRFYEDAKKLDDGKEKPYWSTPHEMAARAFEAYLCDKLKNDGRRNDYLSGHASNADYGGEWYPYPTERDRVKINGAFDELFRVVSETKAIRKSLASADGWEEIEKSLAKPRKPSFVLGRDGRLYVRVPSGAASAGEA